MQPADTKKNAAPKKSATKNNAPKKAAHKKTPANAIKKLQQTIKFYTDKRFSTIAGTLVYFLLLSIAPFILWLTLLFGNLNFGGATLDKLLSFSFFESIAPFLRYLKQSAESAASGAGIVLLVTSLYSSTNFFYHLRRSGEIIYESGGAPSPLPVGVSKSNVSTAGASRAAAQFSPQSGTYRPQSGTYRPQSGTYRPQSGIKLRIASLGLIVASIILFAASAAVIVVGAELLTRVFPVPQILSQALTCVALTALAFLIAVVLNLFACPYKQRLSQVLPGSLLTTALWLIFVIGFGIYSTFARPERLYGKIAAVIIFLLWCYVMICCLVIGIIDNCPRNIRR